MTVGLRPRTTIDPITGDELAPDEVLLLRLQWVIRRWVFLGAVTLLSAGAWTYVALSVGWGLGSGPLAVMTWWNVSASYLALFIEGVVGMNNVHQWQRDAIVLRATRDSVTRVEAVCELILDELRRQER